MLYNRDSLPTVVVRLTDAIFVLLRKLAYLPLLAWEERTGRGSAKRQKCLLRRRPVLLPLETPMVAAMARVGVSEPNWATSISR